MKKLARLLSLVLIASMVFAGAAFAGEGDYEAITIGTPRVVDPDEAPVDDPDGTSEATPETVPDDTSEAIPDAVPDEIPVVDWEMVEGELEELGIEGEFVLFEEVGFEMFLPDFLKPAELPANQPAAQTFIGFFLNETGEWYASVQYLETTIGFDKYREFLESLAGAEDISDFLVNGTPFVFYEIPEAATMSLATYTDGGILEFTFCPVDGEEFGMTAELMGASIHKAE